MAIVALGTESAFEGVSGILEEVGITLGDIAGAAGEAIPAVGVAIALAATITSLLIANNEEEKIKNTSKSLVAQINSRIDDLKNVVYQYSTPQLDNNVLNVAKLFFPKEVSAIILFKQNADTIFNKYRIELDKLEPYYNGQLGNGILVGTNFNSELFTGTTYSYYLTFIDIEYNLEISKTINTDAFNILGELGIIKDPNVTPQRSGSESSSPTTRNYGLSGEVNIISPIQISTLISSLQQLLKFVNLLETLLTDLYTKALVMILQITSPKAGVTVLFPPTTKNPTLDQLFDEIKKGLIAGKLADLIKSLLRSITRTKTINAEEEEEKPKKPKKKHKPKPIKKRKSKTPKKILEAWIDTNDVSQWISKLSFRFPVQKNINSDDRGTLTIHIKKGGTVRFVRVKRGTFSVMALVYGTGFRVWSQFWKKKIVNRSVASWFIQRINAQDREIAIPEEIKDKKIKYK